MKRVLIIPLATVLALGCSTTDNNAGDEASNQDDGGDESTTADSFGMDVTGGGTTGGDGPGESEGDDTAGDTMSFISNPDGGGPINECDQWVQDCPAGEKCLPWANDGGSSWNATKCAEIPDAPGQTGDECSVEGSGVSGEDDCDLGNMCYYVDPETNIGSCVALCFGSPEAPLCDPGFACSISNNGVLTLCRAECDPLLQDCENAACLPAAGSNTFVCIVDASGEAGAAGDPCEFLNACDPGHACIGAEAVGPDCTDTDSCCTQFCDNTAADPDSVCTLQGNVCIDWFEEGEAPPDVEHVGYCGVPA
ncbi:MAG: ribulose phosphate epimerase [Myxococcota bacterium]